MHSRRRYKICTSVILGELERVFELQCINNGFSLVSLAAVFSIVTQRSSPRALRDDTKNGCEGD